jgi:hypothetical protein
MISGNLAISFWRGIKSLDSGLREQVRSKEETIAEQVAQLQKPKRTAAEESRYRDATQGLQLVGLEGRTALRHLLKYGRLVFNMTCPPLPEGMDRAGALALYIKCCENGLVSRRDRTFGRLDEVMPEIEFEIADGMKAALEELLYS